MQSALECSTTQLRTTRLAVGGSHTGEKTEYGRTTALFILPQNAGASGEAISSPSDYPRAYICNECVGVCQQILEEEKREQASPVNRRLPRPPEIKAFLDGYVIGQDRTKKKLAVAVYNHYKRVFLNHQPGDGADQVEHPAGWPDGRDESGLRRRRRNIILKVLQPADGDVTKAQQGIIYIDEIDKISKKDENPSITRDVSLASAASSPEDSRRHYC